MQLTTRTTPAQSVATSTSKSPTLAIAALLLALAVVAAFYLQVAWALRLFTP